ncbi:hypothetical protein RJ55_02823 [Drechmeria coniospora]|nr:hypothetical protein RJ55_02823 [Drechmeria coniospora]
MLDAAPWNSEESWDDNVRHAPEAPTDDGRKDVDSWTEMHQKRCTRERDGEMMRNRQLKVQTWLCRENEIYGRYIHVASTAWLRHGQLSAFACADGGTLHAKSSSMLLPEKTGYRAPSYRSKTSKAEPTMSQIKYTAGGTTVVLSVVATAVFIAAAVFLVQTCKNWLARRRRPSVPDEESPASVAAAHHYADLAEHASRFGRGRSQR